MTLASKHGSPTSQLEKPLREALQQRWRIRLVTGLLLCVTFLALVVSIPRTLAVGDPGVDNAFDLTYHTPWIPKHFLRDYKFNAKVCPSTAMLSPSSCNGNTSVHEDDQCLSFLEGDEARKSVCNRTAGPDREQRLNRTKLHFCHRYSVANVLSPQVRQAVVYTSQCEAVLKDLQALDTAARRLHCEFEDLLSRYNCQSGFSVKWTCENCTRAYQDWVCAMVMPFYRGGGQVRPCRTLCHRVEQQCPYFHPTSREQYAGEPVFICIDPNIPDILSITPNSAYGQSGNCYDVDTLSRAHCDVSASGSSNTISSSTSSPRPTIMPSVTHTPSTTWTHATPPGFLSGNSSSIRSTDVDDEMTNSSSSAAISNHASSRHTDQTTPSLLLSTLCLLQTLVSWTLRWNRTRDDFLASHTINTSS